MDLIYDSPAGYKGSASRSITQLYYDGLDVDTMQLQVMLPFRFVPYETDECNTPRIPTSEFAAPIPLTYWVVRFECTTPQLTYECPHWYDGKWAAATWAPQGGIGGNISGWCYYHHCRYRCKDWWINYCCSGCINGWVSRWLMVYCHR